MSNNQEIRRIENIVNSASSPRVLNLYVATRHIVQADKAPVEKPFFDNDALNNSVILKTRLTAGEQALFVKQRHNGTKIIFPYDDSDLAGGGRTLFIGERGFERILQQNFGMAPRTESDGAREDLEKLDLLNALPTLDPFILRERVTLAGYEVDPRYFDITGADRTRIREFITGEFRPLAIIATGDKGLKSETIMERIAEKLWEARDLEVLRPLLKVLQIGEDQAPAILFAWKAILYYKFMFNDLRGKLQHLIEAFEQLRVINVKEKRQRDDLAAIKADVEKILRNDLATAAKLLSDYDTLYHRQFLRKRDPTAFRAFLEKAPQMFDDIGSRIATVNHAVTYWDYRFKSGTVQTCDVNEAIDIFQDFADGPAG